MNLLTHISFPGLGIDKFKLNSTAISSDSLGFLKNVFGEDWPGVAWYGIIITCGILLSAIYALWRANQEGITTDDMLDVILVAVISSVIGARLYFVVFYNDGSYTSLAKVFAIWEGGLAIYGAVIFGAISLIVMGKIKKMNPFTLLDIGGSAIILGQAIGRWGNFVNAEAYGSQTELPWRMTIFHENGFVESVHPTFLYESLWNIIGFFVIWYLYSRKKYHGQMVLTYLTWYGAGRMFIEGLRTDSLYLFGGDLKMFGNPIRVSQLVGALCFVLGTAALIYFGNKYKKEQKNGNSD